VNLRQVAKAGPEVGWLAPEPCSSPCLKRIYTIGKKWQSGSSLDDMSIARRWWIESRRGEPI